MEANMTALRTRAMPCQHAEHELVWDGRQLRCQVCGWDVPALSSDTRIDYLC